VNAFDDGCIAPVGGREPDASAAGRLNERRRNRESFLRGCSEAGSRLRRCKRKLLQNEVDVGRMAVDSARKIDFRLDCVAVASTVRP